MNEHLCLQRDLSPQPSSLWHHRRLLVHGWVSLGSHGSPGGPTIWIGCQQPDSGKNQKQNFNGVVEDRASLKMFHFSLMESFTIFDIFESRWMKRKEKCE